jgi:hypothetical protein
MPVALSRFDPRSWTRLLAWAFAFIGLLIAWNIIGSNYDEPFLDSFASTFIWLGGLVAGFFGGGAFGQALALRFTPTPAPVVAQPQQVTPTPPPVP